MTYHFEEIADRPVILFTQETNANALADMQQSIPETIERLDQRTEPVFLVLDLSVVAHDLAGNLEASDMSARGENPMLHHPMLREAVFVATDPMLKMSVQGLRSATYGMANVSIHETREAALSYVNSLLGPHDQISAA